MMEYSWYCAPDRRVYNGALCSDMQREHDSIDKLKEMLSAKNGIWTYFPMEAVWSCSLKDFRGNMFYELSWETSLGDALVKAL